MKLHAPLLFLLAALSAPSGACDLQWDYADSSWIEGFRFFQSGTQTGETGPAERSIPCADAGLTPGPGPVTMTAYRGADESAQSDPAVFELIAPGLRIVISTP